MFKICWAAKYVLSKNTWVMMTIERNVEIQGCHLTSCRPKNGKIDEKTRRMDVESPQIFYNISSLI